MTRMIGWIVVASVVSLLASSVVQAGYWDLQQMQPSPSYKEKEEEEIAYANMVQCRQIHMENITGREEMTPGGGPYYIDSFFDIFTEVSTDGGGTWAPMTGQGQALWTFSLGPSAGGVQPIGAEILSMSWGLHKPGSVSTDIQIRESPTKASIGQTTCRVLGGGGGAGGYMIDSFFDIFTEVSTDGGRSWWEATQTSADGGGIWDLSAQSARIDGLPEPATLCLLGLGAIGLLARWRRK